MQYPVIAQPQSAFTPTFAQGGMADTARAVRSYGRDDDTMLVHMTPNEVNSLQGLAMAHGGSLTINPHTGLPEAGFLKSILPLVAGFALGPAGLGMSALGAGLTVGGTTALVSGDLNKGLMAGLGAFGGAGLGGALASTGTEAAKAAMVPEGGVGMSELLNPASQMSVGPPISENAISQLTTAAPQMSMAPAAAPTGMTAPQLATAQAAAPTGVDALGTGAKDLTTPGGMGRFGSAFGEQTGGGLGTSAALMGLSAPFMEAAQPQYALPETTTGSSYSGPYKPAERKVQYPGQTRNLRDSSEFSYFNVTNPYPGIVRYQEGGAVSGGEELNRAVQMPSPDYQTGTAPEFNYNFQPVEAPGVPTSAAPMQGISSTPMRNIPFNPKRAIKQGNLQRATPSNAIDLSGYKYDPVTQSMVPTVTQMAQGGLAALNAFSEGGMPKGRFLQGAGDGTSDSIPATIGGTQPARLADGEFVIDARTVSEIGNGSSKAGAKKLYAMMERVHAERKKAKRGQDSNADRHLPV